VPVRNVEVPAFNDAFIVIAAPWAIPLTSSVVAEAVPANAVRASAAAAKDLGGSHLLPLELSTDPEA
jgi:hypothetical protein